MQSSRFKCYYQGCTKNFRSKVYLVTHINHQHLQVTVLRCENCESLFNSDEDLRNHTKTHKDFNKIGKISHNSLSNINLFDYEYITPNILSLPVLPLIEPDRSAKAFEYKLPLTVRLYESLTNCPDSERK